MNTITMHIGDVRDVMATLPDNYADVLCTSPPFLALRSYLPESHPDKHREIGSEPTPAAFLDTLLGLSADWRRLVPEWGSICVELGDTMSGAGGYGSPDSPNPAYGNDRFGERWTGRTAKRFKRKDDGWPESKSMCLIPHLYTIGLAYGHNPLTGTPSPAGRWRVRNVVAWARPNPPVGSLGKRNVEKRTGDQKFRPATSYITIACTGTGRYFDLDAVRTEPVSNHVAGERSATMSSPTRGNGGDNRGFYTQGNNPAGAPPLDWHTDDLDGDWLWKLATQPYSGSHYAVYPLTLPRRMVLAMCPSRVCQVCGWPSERVVKSERVINGRIDPDAPNYHPGRASTGGGNYAETGGASYGTQNTTLGWTDCGCSDDGSHWRPGRVLDPFGGSGTTAVAAALEGRDAVLIDIDARNIDLVHRRLAETVRIVDRVDHPDRIEWTVTPAAASELAAAAAGQPSLFDPPPKEIA